MTPGFCLIYYLVFFLCSFSIYSASISFLFYHPNQSDDITCTFNNFITKKEKEKEKTLPFPFIFFQISAEIRVFIGFNFKPMLSGERSSGEMQHGLNGLLGLTLRVGLYNPYPMRKYSIGINMAWGCSSVTIDPHA